MTTGILSQSYQFANGIALDTQSRGNEFLGLGAIRAGDATLRNGRRPMFVEIRTPNAVTLCDYTLTGVQQDRDALVFDFAMSYREGGMMEWMVHEVRNRYHLADWTQDAQLAPDTQLRLLLRPVTRQVGAETLLGFSYQYLYHSAAFPIYKILDRGSWEIGGHAVGSEFWMRNCFVPPIVPITSIEQFHSSEWYLPSCANPSVFQFAPLQTELQGFTYTAAESGALITWATGLSHIRSLFEKPRGVDLLIHGHEHCGDLGEDFATVPMEVLWAPGTRDKIGRANLYEAMRELVHDTLHQELGMTRERVETYGQIEEWELPDIKRYHALGLPKLLDAGCKTIYIANHFENNMNTYDVSNMCCTVDYKIAETVGEENLTAFCRTAQAAGAHVEMWGNTSVSTLTVIFDCISRHTGDANRIRFRDQKDSIAEAFAATKDPWVRNPSNAIEADHYTPVFAVMNLRDQVVHDYWVKCWSYAHDQVGLEGIFLDSSFNLSSDKFHYVQNIESESHGGTADQTHLLGFYRPERPQRQAILSMYRAHLDLMTEMQQVGIHYCNEDLGVFGTHRHGPDATTRLDNLFLWSECIASFDAPSLRKAGADVDAVFFQGLAYRMMWSLQWDIRQDRLSFNYSGWRGDFDTPSDWHLALYRAYNSVNSRMLKREILPDEAGVRYTGGAQEVVWSFTEMTLPLGSVTSVRDVLTGAVTQTDRLQAEKHHIYLIGS